MTLVLQPGESEIIANLQHWVINQSLPLWAEVGWNKQTGSFIERLHAGTLVIRKPMPDGPEGALVRSGEDLLLIINTDERLLARQRFTAAHELGHQHFDRGANTTFIERDLFRSDVLEMRANAFAVTGSTAARL